MDRRLVFLSLLLTQFLGAQTPEPPAEARKYHGLLLRRPQAGTLFDRFHDAWLEAASADSLLEFLKSQAALPEAKAADHRLLALLLARRGQDTEALKSLQAALKLSPKDAEAWFEMSRVQGRTLDFESSLKSLSLASESATSEQLRIDIARQQGRTLQRLNRTPEALQTWLGLAKQHPDDLDLAEDVIELMAEEGLYAEAAAEAEKLVPRTKDASEKLNRQLRLGDLLLRAEKRDEALKVLEAALGQSGQDSWVEADILSRLDQVFRREDDLDGLKARLEALLKTHPQRVNVGMGYARVLAELGDKESAGNLFRDLLARNPGRRDLQENYVALLESLELIADAAAQAQVLVNQHPEDKELLIRLATLQQRQKENATAQVTLETYLKKSTVKDAVPENDHLRVARLLEGWGLKEAAQGAYEKMAAAYPQSTSAQEALAHYLHRTEEDAAALKIWRALVKAGNLEDVLRAGQALMAQGLTQEAQEILLTREAEFVTQPRYLAALTQLALANKDTEKAVIWSRARLALMSEASGIQEAVKQAHQAVRDAKAADAIIAELAAQAAITVPNRCLLAELLEESGKTAEAEAALQAPGASPDQRLMLGTQQVRLLEQRQEWARAAEVLTGMTQLPGGMTSDRQQQLARLYRRSAMNEPALAAIQEWKKLSPGAVQPWLEEFSLLNEQGKQTAALDVLRAASRKFNEDTDIMNSLATALAQAGKTEEARTVYMALYEQTEDPVSKLRFLTPLAQMSQYNGALPRLVEEFQQRQGQNRASALPWLALGAIHAAANNDEERRRCLYEASRLRPKDLALLTEIARIEEESGLYEEAMRTLTTAAALDSTHSTKQKIASLMFENGDEEAGYRLIFELAGVETASARAIEKMADTLCEHGEWDRAIALLQPLLQRFPEDYRLHYLFAVALEEEGRQAEASSAFSRLLTMHEELPEVLAAPKTASQQPPSYSVEIPGLPEGTAEWMQLPQVAHTAYQHRQKQRGVSGQWHGGYMQLGLPGTSPALPSGWVQQPATVTNLSAMALYHLVEIGQGMKSDDRAGLIKNLEIAGIREPALLLEVPMFEGRLSIPPDLLEAHPDHRALHALWLMHIQQFQGDLLPGLKRCLALFKDSYPQLAFAAGTSALQLNEPEGDALAQEALEMAERMPARDMNSVNVLVGALIRRQSTAENSTPLAPEVMEKLAARVKRWTDEQMERSQGGSAYSLITLFTSMKRWDEVADLLEKENAYHLKNAVPFRQATRASMGYFEPQMMPAIWSGIEVAAPMTDVIAQITRNPSQIFQTEGEDISEEPENKAGFAQVVSRLKTPGLKILVNTYSGQKEEVKQGIAEMLKQPDVKVGHWLFAAFLTQQQQDWPQLLTLLTGAKKLTLDAPVQQAVDNTLIFTAINLANSGAELLPEHRASVLKSFERIRAAMPLAQQQAYLVEIATTLGFTEQATQLSQVAKVASAPASRTKGGNPYSRQSGRGQQGSRGKLNQLLVKKNQEAAAAEFQREAQRIGEMWLGANWSNARNEVQNLRRILDSAQMTGRMMDGLKAAPKTGWKAMQARGAFFELLGQDADAIEAYEAVVKMRPRAWEVRARLAVLLGREGAAKGLPNLAAIPRLEMRMILQRLSNEMGPDSSREHLFENRLALIRLVAAYVEKYLDPKSRLDPAQLSVFSQMPNRAQQGEYGQPQFPGLYEIPHPGNARETSVAGKKAQAELRAVHDALCQTMMKVPMLAQAGFGPYAGLALHDGQTPENLEATARGVLEKQILAKRYTPNLGYWFGSSVSRHGGNKYQITLPQPEDILLKAILARGQVDKIESDLLPLIKSASGGTAEKQMRKYAKLFTCTEAEFLQTARDWTTTQAGYYYAGSGQEVARIWAERGFHTPIHEIFLERLHKQNASYSAEEIRAYMQTLAKAGRPEEARQFLQSARDLLLGKSVEKKQQGLKLFLQQVSGRRQGMYGQFFPTAKWQYYCSLLSECLRQGPTQVALKVAREDGLLDEPSIFSQVGSNLFDSDLLRGPTDELVAVMEEMQMLAPAEKFRPWFTQRGETYTLLQQLLEALDGSESKAAREGVLKVIAARQPTTFGTDLITSIMHSESEARMDGLNAFLKRRGNELPKLSPKAQHELTVFLEKYVRSYPAGLNEASAQAVEPLTRAEMVRSDQKADAILAAKTWEETNLQDRSPSEFMPEVIRQVAVKDRDKALKLFAHCIALLKRTPAQAQANSQGDGPVYDLFGSMGRVPSLMNEVLAMAEKETLQGEWTARYAYSMEQDYLLQDPHHVLGLFIGTPFVAEAADFSGLPSSDGNALTRLCSNLRGQSSKALPPLLAQLRSRPVQTFGVRLTQVLLEGSNTQMDDFVRENPGDLAKLKPKEASALLNALVQNDAKYRRPDQLPPALQAGLAALLKAQAGDDEKTLRALMDAPSLATADMNDRDGLAKKLRRFVHTHPQEGIPIFEKITLLFAAESRSQNNSPAHTPLAGWLTQCAIIPELFTVAMKRAESEGLTEENNWMRNLVGYLNQNDQMNQPEAVLTFIKGSPFLAAAEDFVTYEIKNDREGSLLAHFAKYAKKNPATSEKLRDMLKDEAPTFGSALLTALVNEHSRDALLEFAQAREDEITRLPPEARTAFEDILEGQMRPLIAYAKATPVLKPLIEAQRQKAEDAKRTLLSISDSTTLDGLQNNEEGLARTLALIVQHDTAGAEEVFHHLVKIIASKDTDSSSQNDPAHRHVARFLQSLKVDPGLWPLMAKEAAKRGLAQNQNWVAMSSCDAYFLGSNTDAAYYVDAFVRSGLFAGAAGIDALQGLGSTDHRSAFHLPPLPNGLQRRLSRPSYDSLLHYFSWQLPAAKFRAAIEGYLEAQKAPTFGMELIATFLKADRNQALNEFATRRAGEFKDLSERAQAGILVAVEKDWTSLNKEGDLPAEVRKALEPLLASRQKQQSQFMNRILQGEAFSSLQLNEIQYIDSCKKLIRELLDKGDEEKAVQVFEKAADIMDAREKSQGWNRYQTYGWQTVRSSFLADCAVARDMASLSLGLKLLNRDTSGRLAHPGFHGHLGWGGYLMQRWYFCGGRADPAAAMEAVITEMAATFKNEPVALMALGFHNMVLRMQPGDVRQLIQWAKALPKSHPGYPLARELAVAAQLQLEADPQGTGPDGTCIVAGAAAHQPLWLHYQKAVTNETLNPRVRIALGYHLCQIYPWAVPADLVLPLAKLTADEALKLNAVSSTTVAAVTRSFGRLEATPEWSATSELLWQGWSKRLRRKDGQTYPRISYGAPLETAFSMLQLAGRLKKDEWIDTLLNEQAPSLKQNRSIVAVLVYAGHPKKAVALLNENVAKMTAWQSGLYPWHPEMRRHLPAFLAACKDPGVALLGELTVLQASDPPPPIARALKIKEPLPERVGKLAARIVTTPFSDESIRYHAASMVANYAPAAAIDHLEEICAKGIENRPIESLLTSNDGGEAAMLAFLHATHIVKEARDGRPEAWMNAYDKLAKSGNNGSQPNQNSLSTLTNYSADAVVSLWERGESRDAGRWLPLFEKVISASPGRADKHTSVAASYAYVLATQTEGGLETWKKKIGDGPLNACKEALVANNRLLETAASYIGAKGSAKRLPDAQRVKLVLDLLTDKDLSNSYELIVRLTQTTQLLTLEEALANAKQIYETSGRKWEIISQIIDCAVSQGKTDAVQPLFDLTLENKQLPPQYRNPLLLRQAAFLIRMGKKTEAAQVLAELRAKVSLPSAIKEAENLEKLVNIPK